MIINLNFNDLNFEKQQEILDWVKEGIFENLKVEAQSKNKTLEKLLWEDYEMDFEFSDEEKKLYFKTSLNEFLEKMALEKIHNGFQNLSVEINTYD